MRLPSIKEFNERIISCFTERSDVLVRENTLLSYQLAGAEKSYDIFQFSSAKIIPTDPIVLIRAGIHGDEIFGPLTLMKYSGEIFSYAHERGVKLIIFPLDNPSGFEGKTRYNVVGDIGEGGNNDYLRYRISDGRIVGDLGTSDEFVSWFWASDPGFNIHLPAETLISHQALQKLPLNQVRALIDLHADNYIIIPGTYYYSFANGRQYETILNRIERVVPILRNEYIDSGFLNIAGYTAEEIQAGHIVKDQFNPKTDQFGSITRHDGTLPDLFHRLGALHCLTIEITGATDPAAADIVNLAWIHGLIDLVA